MATLEPGRPVEGVFAVRRKERRMSRKGSPYLALTLGDATGTIPAVIFDEPDWFAGQFEEGDRVRVTGEVTDRGGRAVLRVRSLRPAEAADAEVDLLPRSHRDPEDMWGFVLGLADEVHEPGLRALLDAMTADAALADAWRTVPCTRSGHHAYLGGLVEHTVGVAMLCQSLSTWHPRLDADLLIYATGYSSMHHFVRDIVSEGVADAVGRVWGYGSGAAKDPGPYQGELRNMWRPTAVPGLWFMGGNLAQARHYSRLVALQLAARHEGLSTPVYGVDG